MVGIPVENDGGRFVVWAAHDGRAGHETVERVDRSLVVGTLLAFAADGTVWATHGAAPWVAPAAGAASEVGPLEGPDDRGVRSEDV